MTKAKEEKQEVEIWKPEAFKGTDLLPMERSTTALAPGEELVGEENIDPADLILPVLSVMTGTSDLVKRQVEGARPGLAGITTLDLVFELPLRLIFVHHHKSRAKFATPSDPVRCIAKDGDTGDKYGNCEDCGRSEWDGDSKPICSQSNNFVCWTPHGPAMLRCNNSNFKTGSQFVTKWKNARRNMWHHPVMLTAREKSGVINGLDCVWYPIELTWMERETVPPDVREQCRQTWEGIAAAHDSGRLRGGTDED